MRRALAAVLVAGTVVAARGQEPDPLPEGAVARLGTMRFRHDGPVKALAFSPDGKTLTSASGTTQAWDVATGAWLHGFVGMAPLDAAVACSPNGKLVAGGDAFNALRVWDPATGKCLYAVGSPAPSSLAFGPDGSRLAGAVGSQVVVWDVTRKGAEVLRLGELAQDAFAPRVACLRWSPDGKRLAAGRGKTVHVWDAETGKERLRLHEPAHVTSLDVSADGKTLTLVTEKRTRAVARESGDEVRGVDHGARHAAFSPDGRTLATARANELTLTDLAGDATRHAWVTWHRGPITVLAFSPDGKLLASGSHDGTIRLWDVATRKEVRPFEGHPNGVRAVTFSPDGKTVASGGLDSTIRLWDVATRTERRLLTWKTARPLDLVSSVAFSPDGNTLASGCWDNSVRLWDPATGKETRVLSGHTQKVNAVVFASGGKELLSASDDGTVRVWDPATGALARTLGAANKNTNVGGVEALSLSPDGASLATGHNDGQVVLWDLATGAVVRRIAGSGWIAAVAFAPDGKRVAAATTGNPAAIRIFDVATGEEDRKLELPKDGAEALVYTPDGERLVSGGKDSVVRFWKPAGLALGGREKRALKARLVRPEVERDKTIEERLFEGMIEGFVGSAREANQGVHCLAVSPDGKLVASGSEEGTVILWDAAP